MQLFEIDRDRRSLSCASFEKERNIGCLGGDTCEVCGFGGCDVARPGSNSQLEQNIQDKMVWGQIKQFFKGPTNQTPNIPDPDYDRLEATSNFTKSELQQLFERFCHIGDSS